jgi:hypothetical protein
MFQSANLVRFRDLQFDVACSYEISRSKPNASCLLHTCTIYNNYWTKIRSFKPKEDYGCWQLTFSISSGVIFHSLSRVVLTIKDLWRESLACGKYVVHDGEIRRTSTTNISRHNRFCCKFCLYTEYVYFYVIITLLPFFIEMLQYDWLWSGHMIIKEMFHISTKLKSELARASMTTSDVNNQWRSNFQQQII